MEKGALTASRRAFLEHAGKLLGVGWLGMHAAPLLAAAEEARVLRDVGAPMAVIDAESARLLAAVADQVWPPDDTAGAAELGAVYFMDYAFGAFMAGPWPMVQAGLAVLNDDARAQAGVTFDALPFDAQTRVLQARQDEPFFGVVHLLTLLGCFSLPEYGGNIDGGGWDQLGFEQQHYWVPPFGHYDRGQYDA